MSTKRGERVLGPYEQHNGWRVIEIDGQGKRKSSLFETEQKAQRFIDIVTAARTPFWRSARDGRRMRGDVGHGDEDEDEVATTGRKLARERGDGRGVQLGPRIFGRDAAVVLVATRA